MEIIEGHGENNTRSPRWVVLGPPTVGGLVSLLLIFIGPFHPIFNYLVVGAAWGISFPLRKVVRSALKYSTREFQDYPWKEVIRDEVKEVLEDWRRKPKEAFVTWGIIAGLETVAWPILIPVGTRIHRQLDVG